MRLWIGRNRAFHGGYLRFRQQPFRLPLVPAGGEYSCPHFLHYTELPYSKSRGACGGGAVPAPANPATFFTPPPSPAGPA